jgi:anti-sigma regulatory factor (Ser/Thr protein kinase)
MTQPHTPFQHEALLYEGPEGFLAGTLPFLEEGLEAGEPMLVAVGAPKIERLKAALGGGADRVDFVDMAVLGRNPGRIIPAWREFLGRSGDGPVRGIGEPIWAGRDAAEMVECQLHESLLNVAFADVEGFRLLCPYDTTALEPGVVHEACSSHPLIADAAGTRPSRQYRGDDDLLVPFDAPLPAPPAVAELVAFDGAVLEPARRAVAAHARAAGLVHEQVEDLMLAVSEVAANSVRHGGGHGLLRVWRDDAGLVCEVRDSGRIRDPLAGRARPDLEQLGGWGLWLAHQLCDLVQLRSDADGTVVRLLMRRPERRGAVARFDP